MEAAAATLALNNSARCTDQGAKRRFVRAGRAAAARSMKPPMPTYACGRRGGGVGLHVPQEAADFGMKGSAICRRFLGSAVGAPQCQSSRSVASSVILIPIVRRAWAANTCRAHCLRAGWPTRTRARSSPARRAHAERSRARGGGTCGGEGRGAATIPQPRFETQLS